MPKNKKSGFSLMEALVSFVIIAVFLAIVVPMITGISDANGITGYFSNYEEVGYPITKKVDGFEGNTIYVKAGEKDENPIKIDGILYKNDGYGEPKVKKRKIFIRVSDLPVFKEPTGETKACLAVFDVKDFDKIRDNQDGCFVLMDDINFTEYRSKETGKNEPWTWSPIPSFSGRLYGNGKILYNLHDSLFNNLKSGALIQDFGIHDSTFISGALANTVDGGAQIEIRNIYLRDVKIKRPDTKTITGEVAIGGLIDKVGENASVKITLFKSNAEFDIGKDENTEGHYLGGIIGKTESQRLAISRSSNYADIKAAKYTIGGFVGLNQTGKVEIKYSLNEGSLNGSNVGGLIGSSIGEDVTIKESYSKCFLTSEGFSGGLVGNIDNTLTITDSYAVNTFSGGTDVGGMVGRVHDNIDGSYTVTLDNTYVLPRFEDPAAGARIGLFLGSVENLDVATNNGNYYYLGRTTSNITPEFWGTNNDGAAVMPESTAMTLVTWNGDKKWFAAEGGEGKQADLFTTLNDKTWLLEKKFRPILKRAPESLTGQYDTGNVDHNALPDFLANNMTEEEFIEAAKEQYEDESLSDEEKIINTFFNLDQLCEKGVIDCTRDISKTDWTIDRALNTSNSSYLTKCNALKNKVEGLLNGSDLSDRKRLDNYMQHVNCTYQNPGGGDCYKYTCPGKWSCIQIGTNSCSSDKTCDIPVKMDRCWGGYARWGVEYDKANKKYKIKSASNIGDSSIQLTATELEESILESLKIDAKFANPIRRRGHTEIMARKNNRYYIPLMLADDGNGNAYWYRATYNSNTKEWEPETPRVRISTTPGAYTSFVVVADFNPSSTKKYVPLNFTYDDAALDNIFYGNGHYVANLKHTGTSSTPAGVQGKLLGASFRASGLFMGKAYPGLIHDIAVKNSSFTAYSTNNIFNYAYDVVAGICPKIEMARVINTTMENVSLKGYTHTVNTKSGYTVPTGQGYFVDIHDYESWANPNLPHFLNIGRKYGSWTMDSLDGCVRSLTMSWWEETHLTCWTNPTTKELECKY